MTTPTELVVLQDVTERLETAGLAYMLTGSLAQSYYAEPRMTRDIDLVVALSPSDSELLNSRFRGDYYVPEELADAIRSEGFFNMLHLDTVTKVDIIVRKDTTFRLHEFDRRRRIAVGALSVWIVTKEDLILSKLDWARDSRSPAQLDDVRHLLASGYDRDYVERWVQDLQLDELWKSVHDA